jgi:hypothetical protein
MISLYIIFTLLALSYIFTVIYLKNRDREMTSILPITIQDTDEFEETETLINKTSNEDDCEWNIVDKSQ